MKKKLLATLIAGAVLSTGIIGLTACNIPGSGDNNGDGSGTGNGTGNGEEITTVVKGTQVDAEGWAKAFETTLAAENYTAKIYVESIYKAKGTHEELGEIDLSVTTTEEGPIYCNNGESYTKAKIKVVATGVPDDEVLQEQYKNQEFDFENYDVKDGETYYSASYMNNKEDAKWSVSTYSTSNSDAGAVSILNVDFATEEDGETVSLAELYEAFTYEDGVYTATLWQYDEVTVSVSIKDGYVVGYSTDVLYEEEDEDGKESEGYKTVYNFSNFGSTTVTPSDAAKKAVEDYIAEQASEED